MVSQGDKVSPDAIRSATEERKAHLARPLLEIRGEDRRVQPLGTLNDQLDSEPSAHSTHEFFIAIRLITANPMVQMRCGNFQPKPMTQLDERASKRNRISSARKSDQ